jgi:hypothetical protein
MPWYEEENVVKKQYKKAHVCDNKDGIQDWLIHVNVFQRFVIIPQRNVDRNVVKIAEETDKCQNRKVRNISNMTLVGAGI